MEDETGIDQVASEPSSESGNWLVALYGRIVQDSIQLTSLHRLTVRGIHALTTGPSLVQSTIRLRQLRGLKAYDGEEEGLREANEEAALAKAEIDAGFPVTNAQHLVDMWALTEAFVRDVVTGWLQYENGMQSDAVLKLKVPLGAFLELEGAARYQYVTKLLEHNLSSSLKAGIDRYESLLGSVGLDGPVPKRLRDAIYEHSQLRNCIVHNGRRVDSQLLSACPWLAWKIGDQIAVDGERLRLLGNASRDYATLVMARAARRIEDYEDPPLDQRVQEEWGNPP